MSVTPRLGLDVAEDIASSYAALARARVQLLAAVENLPGLEVAQEQGLAPESAFTRALTHVIQSEWHFAMARQCLLGPAWARAGVREGATTTSFENPAASIRERLLAALCEATEDEIGRVVAGANELPNGRRRFRERATGVEKARGAISFP